MPVISTRRARQSPITAPTTIAATSSVMPIAVMSCVARPMVAASAMAMPAMPKTLPFFALSCRDSPARLRMNSRAATMYAADAAVVADMRSAPREHAEHAAGHGEAAEDVDAGHQDRDRGQRGDHRPRRGALGEGAHGAHPA